MDDDERLEYHVALAIEALARLPGRERVEVFKLFCPQCGEELAAGTCRCPKGAA